MVVSNFPGECGAAPALGKDFRALGKIGTLEEIELNETWLTYEKGFSHLKNLAALKKITLTKVVATDEDIAKLTAC